MIDPSLLLAARVDVVGEIPSNATLVAALALAESTAALVIVSYSPDDAVIRVHHALTVNMPVNFSVPALARLARQHDVYRWVCSPESAGLAAPFADVEG